MTNNNIYYGNNHTFVPKINNIVGCPLLGWESQKRWGNQIGPTPGAIKNENLVRFVGYIPGVHIATGIGLSILGIQVLRKKEYTKALGERLVLRGLATIAFGPLLAIADLAKYHFQNKKIDKILKSGGQNLYISKWSSDNRQL
jgi:hypothetical protein